MAAPDDPLDPVGGEPGAAAGDDHVDALPEDLDVTALVGPYVFPDNARRRVQGAIYLATAAVLAATWAWRSDGGVLVNRGWLLGAGLAAALGVYCLVSAA